jgi:hypothetical protein
MRTPQYWSDPRGIRMSVGVVVLLVAYDIAIGTQVYPEEGTGGDSGSGNLER